MSFLFLLCRLGLESQHEEFLEHAVGVPEKAVFENTEITPVSKNADENDNGSHDNVKNIS